MNGKSKRRARTRDTIVDASKLAYQRMMVCIQLDIPDDGFDRDVFNDTIKNAAHTLADNFPGGARLVLLTTEEVIK